MITSNNKAFIADNSVNRIVCLRWTPKTQRKEIFPAGRGWYRVAQPNVGYRTLVPRSNFRCAAIPGGPRNISRAQVRAGP
jgi:hypothetical protein